VTQKEAVPRSRAATAHSSTSVGKRPGKRTRRVATLGGRRARGRAAAALAASQCGSNGRRGRVRGASRLRWAGRLGAQRGTRSEGGRGSTGGGGSWHERQGAGAVAVSGCALEKVGGAVRQRQCRKQRRARGWPLSSIGRTTQACRAEGQRSGGRGSGRAVLRCGGRRHERCELWVRGTTRERKQFGPLLLPTHSSACIPHGTVEGAQKPPIVREAFLSARSS